MTAFPPLPPPPWEAVTRGGGAPLGYTAVDLGNPCQPTSNAGFRARLRFISLPRTPIPPMAFRDDLALSEGGLAVCGRCGFSPRSGEKRVHRMLCAGLSWGPTTSSTPELGQVMGEEGGLIWRRKGIQNEQRRTAPETASRFCNRFPKIRKSRKRLVARNSTAYPVENQPLPISPTIYARGGSGFGNRFSTGTQKGKNRKEKAPARANSKAQSEDRFPGRRPYRSMPLREDLTRYRNAQNVRLID